MADHATSSAPAVQQQLDRLWALSPGADILGLERITALLRRLGDPHRRLPPVFHVAGTNGKGSTCAFLRTALEASGHRVHVYSSPHLVRFNERIRLAGTLIADDLLAALLSEVLDAGGDIGASFFEVTTAVAFLAFSRVPAEACVIEVGLGGRLDATNVVPAPAVTGIAQLGIDHQAFLGDTAEQIAAEKAGIAKPGVPLVTMAYPAGIAAIVGAVAKAVDSPVQAEGGSWHYQATERLTYTDAAGSVETPLPAMAGVHQPGNLALAIAMLRHQSRLPVPVSAYAVAATDTHWPARMQRLRAGPLTASLPAGSDVWVDGGHNAGAGAAIRGTLERLVEDGPARPVAVILGMLANKDPKGLLGPSAALIDSLTAVPVTGHDHHAPLDLVAVAQALGIAESRSATDIVSALSAVAAGTSGSAPPIVLILGSLYLAGEVLAANDEPPD